MFKSVKSILAIVALIFGLASCSLLKEQAQILEDQKLVITTIPNVQEQFRNEVKFVPTDMIPAEFKTAWADEVVVIAREDQLVADGKAVPISVSSERWSWDSILTLLETGLTVGSTWLPPLALLEGILTMLFPRKRQNYTNMLKNLIPSDGKIDIKAAAADAIKGLGWVHSSEKTAEVFKAEQEMKKTSG